MATLYVMQTKVFIFFPKKIRNQPFYTVNLRLSLIHHYQLFDIFQIQNIKRNKLLFKTFCEKFASNTPNGVEESFFC